MDDRRLAQLLRMAAEAERLEEATLPFTRPGSRGGISMTRWMGIGSIAAAVVVGASLWVSNAIAPTPVVRPIASNTIPKASDTPSVVAVSESTPVADPCDNESTVLLALFRKADGNTQTMRFSMQDWDSRRGLNDLAEGELIGFAFEHQDEMTPENLPDSVVLLAVSGPSELIPRSDEEAAHLAACLQMAPTTCGEEVPCYTSAALQCLPAGVSVHAEARVVR